MGLMAWLRGGTRTVNTFEAAILKEVEKLLDPSQAERFRARLAAISLVQRHGGGQEIYLYQKRGGKVVFPGETAIVDDLRSIDFAEVETRSGEHTTSRLRAVIGLQNGNLASIEFNRPSEHASLDDVDEIRARLLGPPFRDPDAAEDALGGWPA